jgi:hypothetical protein
VGVDWRIGASNQAKTLRTDAERAIASVVEAECPLCKVELRIHDERACCTSAGDSYRAGPHRLEIHRCAEHGRDCEHWEALWSSRL